MLDQILLIPGIDEIVRGVKLDYLIKDDFSNGDLTAGNVDGTPASHKGTRSVVDTGNLESISGSKLLMDDGSNTDPLFYLDAITRASGVALVGTIDLNSTGVAGRFGFGDSPSSQLNAVSFHDAGAGGAFIYEGGGLISVAFDEQTTENKYCIILLDLGGWYFRNVNKTGWRLLYVSKKDNTATLYPGLNNYGLTVVSMDYIAAAPIPNSWALSKLIAYDDFSAPTAVAVDSGSNGLNGTIVDCGLGGDNGIFSDEILGFVNVYSASMNSLLVGNETSIIITYKPIDDWTLNSTSKTQYMLEADNSNYLKLRRNGPVGLSLEYTASGSLKTFSIGALSGTVSVGLSVSELDDTVSAFLDGGFLASQSSLTAWTGGNWNSTQFLLGGLSISPVLLSGGWYSNFIITLNGVVATVAQMEYITDRANTITAEYLDTAFGAGNYAWYKLDEENHTLTAGPDAQTIPSRPWKTQTGGIIGNELRVVPVLGADLVVNGDFAADSDWDKGTDWTIGSDVATRAAGAGATNIVQTVTILTADKWYSATWDVETYIAGEFNILFGTINGPVRASAASFYCTHKSNGTAAGVRANAAGDGNVDNIEYKETTLSSTISSITDGIIPYVLTQAEYTITDNTQAGWMVALDDPNNPQDYIHVYFNRVDAKIYVDNVASGVPTNVTSAAATYSATGLFQVRLSDSDLWVWYDGAYILNTAITLPAGAGNYTAVFATNPDTRVNEVEIAPMGIEGQYIKLGNV